MSLLLVFLIGAVLGGQVNRAIDALAWNRRSLGPWSSPASDRSAPGWLERVPIVGWWRMRHRAQQLGDGFWVRPLLIELFLATGLATLYWFERNQGILPLGAAPVPLRTIHLQFASHALLICLMTVATFIDLDEKLIPDSVTLPGTLLGLALAALLPESLLPAWTQSQPPIATTPLLLTSPLRWPDVLSTGQGVLLGTVCVLGWWYALLPKTLWYRGGLRRFARYLVASILRHPHTKWVTVLALLVQLVVVVRWWIGGLGWQGLLSALVGMAAAGLVVWIVRIVASLALDQEAMGFGDVTLMGMIGSFLGWQPAVLVFFLAPFSGVAVALPQWLLTGRKDVAFGPYLCLSALLVIVFWPVIWETWVLPVSALGGLIPAVIAICLGLLGLLLLLLRCCKSGWRAWRGKP